MAVCLLLPGLHRCTGDVCPDSVTEAGSPLPQCNSANFYLLLQHLLGLNGTAACVRSSAYLCDVR